MDHYYVHLTIYGTAIKRSHLDGLVDLVVLAVDDEADAVRRLAERVQRVRVRHRPQVLAHHLQNLKKKSNAAESQG